LSINRKKIFKIKLSSFKWVKIIKTLSFRIKNNSWIKKNWNKTTNRKIFKVKPEITVNLIKFKINNLIKKIPY
jgi:hypothetical protein